MSGPGQLDGLEELAAATIDRTRPDEQVEVFVRLTRTTSVRVVAGEVKHFIAAEAGGVGIRVVAPGGGAGFAYAGSLSMPVVVRTLEASRTIAALRPPDATASLAEPDGVPPPAVDLWSDELDRQPGVLQRHYHLIIHAPQCPARRRERRSRRQTL